MKNWRHALIPVVLAGCAALAWMLAASMLNLPAPAVDLRQLVHASMADSGVTHPVTAVLLNFRGYDTLLEIGVLLLAMLGMLAGAHGHPATPVSPHPGLPLLQSLARLLAPLMVLVAGYLLWAGSSRPGGAFQAGAVLAAMGVLLHLAKLLPAWTAPSLKLRIGLTIGFLVFLAVSAGLAWSAHLLQYPPSMAGVLILLIESGLSLSIGLILGGLFLLLSEDEETPQ